VIVARPSAPERWLPNIRTVGWVSRTFNHSIEVMLQYQLVTPISHYIPYVANQVKKIEAEAAKGEAADPSKLERWMTTLAKMAPDIIEVMAASLAGPVAGFTVVFKKIVERAKASSAEA